MNNDSMVGGLRAVEEERDRLREQRDALAQLCEGMLRQIGYAPADISSLLARIRAEGPEPGPTREKCEECEGTGSRYGDAPDCPACGGSGEEARPTREDVLDLLAKVLPSDPEAITADEGTQCWYWIYKSTAFGMQQVAPASEWNAEWLPRMSPNSITVQEARRSLEA